MYARCIIASLVFGQCLLFGLFSLKDGYAQALSIFPPLVYTCQQWSRIGRINKIARNLPLLECHAVGCLEGKQGATELGFLNHAFYPDVMSPERVPVDPTTGTHWDRNVSRTPSPSPLSPTQP
jgi:hypothetical protein